MGLLVDNPKFGEIRLQTEKNVLVEIGGPWNNMIDKRTYWRATEIVSGETYWALSAILGEPLNEMEVMAWAAS